MTVRFILGREGTGKSLFIFADIKKSLINETADKLFLIVPEQFTLQTERDLIEKTELPGIMRIEVLSFNRLAHRVFSEIGGLTRTLLTEQGKYMILRKIINEREKDLTIFKKAVKDVGFVEKIGRIISEFKQQDIFPEDLRAKIEELGSEVIVGPKIHDIAVIYESFNQYLQDCYLDVEDYLNLFIEKLQQADFLQNARIWIDGFTSFSLQNIRIIEQIMLLADTTTLSFTLDPGRDIRDKELFDISQITYERISRLVEQYGMKTKIINLDPNSWNSTKSRELLHVETEFFSYPFKQFKGSIEHIDLFAAANINTEIENVAAKVVSLVRDKGYRFKDIAVVSNDIERYSGLIKKAFTGYNIPYFIDHKLNTLENPLVCLILSSLEVIQRGYRYEDVFSLLKTGFSQLTDDEYEMLENYVLRYGIQGNKWHREFHLGEKETLEELNRYRHTFMNPIQALEEKIKGKKTFAAITRALYQYLQAIAVPENLENRINQFTELGLYELANENTRIWNIIMEVFDQMVDIMGDQEVNIKEYRKVLEAGFLSYEVGIIPTTIDQVLLLNIQRSKSRGIKALFIVGVNDGILPSGQDEEEILSGDEKETIQDMGLDLGFSKDRNSDEERLLTYNTLAKPDDYLWISYALADEEGKSMRPSLFINRFKKLFPDLRIKSDIIKDRQSDWQMVSTPVSSFKYLIENLRLFLDGKAIEDFWWDVYGWYYSQPDWDDIRTIVIEGFFHRNQVNHVGREQAKSLYNLPLRTSVSRLEQFVNCPFAHFVRYGLKPLERKLYTMDSLDIGDFFHECIRSFAESLSDNDKNWRQIEKEECIFMMDKVMDKQIPGHASGVLMSTHRYQYLAQRLKRIGQRAVWTLTQHIKKGAFEPLGYELYFGDGGEIPSLEIKLMDGERFYLEGRIDRVDILNQDDLAYVKIIDYKTGDKNLNLSDVYYGLSLQLFIYLQAVLNSRKDLKPAGVFYFKIDDPIIQTEKNLVEEIEKEIAKKFKMRGIVLDDTKIIRQIDNEIQGFSDIIPVRITGEGKILKNSFVLKEENFSALLRHVEKLAKEIGQEIIQGKVKINPIKLEKQKACDYCLYRSICQFDQLFIDNNYKNLKRIKDEEVIFRLPDKKGGDVVDELDTGTKGSNFCT